MRRIAHVIMLGKALLPKPDTVRTVYTKPKNFRHGNND